MSSKLLPTERSRFWLYAIAAMMLSLAAQLNFDIWRTYAPPKIASSYNDFIEPQPLSATYTRATSFGATEFAADIYWLKLIQYYGGGDPGGKYRKLAELFNTVTDLSPRFTAAYTTGLITLPGEGFVTEALLLGEKGKQNLPADWQMPYYTGLVYHIYKKDYIRAAEEFTKAAELPNAPDNVTYMAALYYKEGDKRKIAYELFKTIHETTTDSFIKERSIKYVVHLEGIFYLEDAVAAFKAKNNRFPSDLNELQSQKIISAVPVSPLGFSYHYNSSTGEISDRK